MSLVFFLHAFVYFQQLLKNLSSLIDLTYLKSRGPFLISSLSHLDTRIRTILPLIDLHNFPKWAFLNCCWMGPLIDIMWLTSQSHFHLSFIFIEINFYSLSVLCDVCNEVHEHKQ